MQVAGDRLALQAQRRLSRTFGLRSVRGRRTSPTAGPPGARALPRCDQAAARPGAA